MKLSLGRKIVIIVTLTAVIISVTCVTVSSIVFRKIMDNEYVITADSMAATVAGTIDGDKLQPLTEKIMAIYKADGNKISNEETDDPGFEDYAAQYLDIMNDQNYIDVQKFMRSIQDVSEVDCVYTVCVDLEDKTAVYIVDAAYDDELVTPGRFDNLEEYCYKYIDEIEKGFPAFVSETPEYGWVVTSFAPIFNSSGEFVCYAAVDLDMNAVVASQKRFIYILAAALLMLTVFICIIAILYVRTKIVTPINMLSKAAGQYGIKNGKAYHHQFRNIDIHTGDELEILLSSMKQMEKDIDNYIDSLTQTKAQLNSARQKADDLHDLAHLDSLTGINNRLAYDKEIITLDAEIRNGFQSFGIAMIDLNYLKRINDSYGHECGNAAIISLSSIICDIFTESPVFRIGGDEFAIILQNDDYANIESLAQEFNQRLEQLTDDSSLEPWEKITAALGYSLFDPLADHCSDDVFKRADKNMYQRKKDMKGERM